MRRAILRSALALPGLLLLPAPSHAHLVNTGLGPYYDGVSHFALTPEDLLPALAMALLAGQKGSGTGRLALFALPGASFLGGLAGLAFPTISSAPALTTVSFLALGGLVAADVVVPFDLEIECWHGFDGSETWSEGRRATRELIGGVAPGRYRLRLAPQAGKPLSKWAVKVTSGAVAGGRLVLALLALLAWPVITGLGWLRFEHQRWSESDHPWTEED